MPTDDPATACAEWIGRSFERRDVIAPRMAACFEATLAPHVSRTGAAPPGIFWCLAPDIVPAGELGGDGHPRTGRFLPPLPYPRRMWAGGELAFHGAFNTGDEVVKTSTIENIAFKSGSSGKLAFVTVRHRYDVGSHLVLDERQDIVYREPQGAGAAATQPPRSAPADVARRWDIAADPVLLMRYSALTFNGHRIHYDHPYATGTEGYDGLVVHGPLQATLMLNIAADVLGRLPQRFSYRGQAPLICGPPFAVEALHRADGTLATQVVDASGTITMNAQAVA